MRFRGGAHEARGIAATVFPEFVACEPATQTAPNDTSAVKAAARRNRVQMRMK